MFYTCIIFKCSCKIRYHLSLGSQNDCLSCSIIQNRCMYIYDARMVTISLQRLSHGICIVGREIALQIQLGRAIRWPSISGDPLALSRRLPNETSDYRAQIWYEIRASVARLATIINLMFDRWGESQPEHGELESLAPQFLSFFFFFFGYLVAARQRTQICWSPRDKRSLGSRSPKAVRRLVGRTMELQSERNGFLYEQCQWLGHK